MTSPGAGRDDVIEAERQPLVRAEMVEGFRLGLRGIKDRQDMGDRTPGMVEQLGDAANRLKT
jgi:hypothetical protein